MSSIDEFKHESLQDRESISKYLKTLTDGFQASELIFRNDVEQIILNPEGMIQMELKAKRKDKKVKLSLKLEWKERPHTGDKEDKLVIDSKL
jgi:amphi-Trp domain-containing protein